MSTVLCNTDNFLFWINYGEYWTCPEVKKNDSLKSIYEKILKYMEQCDLVTLTVSMQYMATFGVSY